MIGKFIGEYRFLSNFYNAPVSYDGYTFKNNEAAFQSQKIDDPAMRGMFVDMEAATAKKFGRRLPMRQDWNYIKDNVMYEICKAKFTQNAGLAKKLVMTYEEELVEGNTWGDTYWGVVDGFGQNKLGNILMRVRDELIGRYGIQYFLY